jgi:hypothetical protein
MAENIISRSFNKIEIHQKTEDGYINLNQMADATGKRIDNWLRLQETKELIAEFDQQQIDSSDLRNRSVAVISIKGGSGGGGGTWAHPDIALQFAQWCSPSFALQVSRWVREWMTTGRNPLIDSDRVGLRSTLKDDSRVRMTDQVKVYLESIKRYDDKKYSGIYFARVHDLINKLVTTETSKQMRDRLSQILGKNVSQSELIRDYFPISVLKDYIGLCEVSANIMLKQGLQPITAVEQAAEMFLPANYEPKPIDFVEHIKFVRQRLEGQGQIYLEE